MSKKKKTKRSAGSNISSDGAGSPKGAKQVLKKRDSNGREIWPDYLMVALALVMVCGSLLFFVRAVYLIVPYTINYSEDSLLASALEIAAGRNPYNPRYFLTPPFILTPYPPVFYILLAAAAKITGPSLLPGRIISMLSSLGIAMIIFQIIKREKNNVFAAAIGGIAYLSLYPVSIWGATHRVDNLTLLFAVGALYLGTGKESGALRRSASLALLILSALTKQSSVAALFVVLICLWRENRRLAAWFAIGYAAIWGAIFAFMHVISHGGYFFATVTSLSSNPISWERFAMLTGEQFGMAKNISMAALVLFALVFKHIKFDRWAIYATLAAVQGLTTVGKFGSGPNYFLEFVAALAILLGMVLAVFHENARAGKSWGLFIISFVLLIAVVMGIRQESTYIGQPWLMLTRSNKRAGLKADEDIVRQYTNPGDYLLTKRIDLALLTGRIPLMNDPFTFSFLTRIGKWDETGAIGMLRSASIPLVIIDTGPNNIAKTEFLSDALKAEVKQHYVLFAVSNGIFFYRPNQLQGGIPEVH